ncbi:MAG: glycosyltransferase [Phycisphaerales bacterium]
MRVGQFIQSIDVTAGGTSTAFLGTLAALRTRAGLGVRAYSARPVEGDPAWQEVEADPASFTLVTGFGRGLSPGALGEAVAADVRGGRLDLLHVHGLWSPDLLAAGRACVEARVPLVWEPHGMLVREAYAQKRLKKELFMALGMRRVLRSAAALLFVTEEERETSVLPRGIARERLRVVPLPVRMPGVEADGAYRARARARFGVPEGVPCVVFMGRLHPVKRVEMALRALAASVPAMPDLRLLLVGGGEAGYEAELRSLAGALGVGGRVTFAGWVKGEDKWLALAAGDVLTLHSLHENFGFVAPEALCVGAMPVLTSNLALAAEMKVGGWGWGPCRAWRGGGGRGAGRWRPTARGRCWSAGGRGCAST